MNLEKHYAYNRNRTAMASAEARVSGPQARVSGPERPGNLGALLEHDAACRKPGALVDDKELISIDSLTAQDWDFSAPTLVDSNRQKYYRVTTFRQTQDFTEAFYKMYPILKGVSLDNLLVAGSSVAQFVQRSTDWVASDVDIFIYGVGSPGNATDRVDQLIRDLETQERKKGILEFETQLRRIVDAPASIPKGHAHDQALIKSKAAAVLMKYVGFNADAFEKKDDAVVMRKPDDVDENTWSNATKDSGLQMLGFHLPRLEAVRTGGSISVTVNQVKIQLILRIYKTKSEVLHGFDLGASAAGFDGENVWLTQLGRFAHECGYNIIDTTRRSLTYESRLEKYRTRGFDIIAPELDVSSLPRRNLRFGLPEVADLPRFPFVYNKIDGLRVFVDQAAKRFGNRSDYDMGGIDDEEEEDCSSEKTIALQNLFKLVNEKGVLTHLVQSHGVRAALDILKKPPHLTLDMVQRLYDQIRAKSWRRESLDMGLIRRYVPTTTALTIVEAMSAGKEDSKTIVDKAFDHQRAVATDLWNKAVRDADHAQIPWITENPGGQGPLTGSMNPIMEDPIEWYGEHYLCPSD